MLRSSPLARRPFSADRPAADIGECIASAKVEKLRNHARSPYRAALQFRRRLALAVAEMRHTEPANASFRVSLVLRIILGAMTSKELEAAWVSILICPCPHCAHPRVDHAVLGFSPDANYLNNLKLAMIECERCHEKFRPLPPGCHHKVFEFRQRRDFQPRTVDK